MNTRYLPYIGVINQKIARFNEFLREDCHIPAINSVSMMKDGVCVQVIHGDWDGFPFPKAESRGVYFIFGYDKSDNNKTGIYIGKASFGSTIGRRLYSHFNKFRNEPYFEMGGYGGEPYVLEYIISIDLEEAEFPFMSPALEEFMISELRSEINLMNGTGNRVEQSGGGNSAALHAAP